MQTEVSGSQRTARVAAIKGFGVGALVVGLIALMAMAALRETASTKPQLAIPSIEAHQARAAITADEESYARTLWPIHTQVKQDAVKMTFAGLAYKMGDISRQAVKERVAPLTAIFGSAVAALDKIQPPASMRALHGEYMEAIQLYRDASLEMIKVASDGRDVHLVEAQKKSARASDLTLKVGDILWPGEFKPN
jgi:hypothetical protein